MNMNRSDKQIIKLALSIRKASVDDLVLLCAMVCIRLNYIDSIVKQDIMQYVFDSIESIENNKHTVALLGVNNEKADS